MSDQERIAKLEARFDSLEDWMKSISTDVKELNKKAHMGVGALWIILKVGAVVAAGAAALAYVLEKLKIIH